MTPVQAMNEVLQAVENVTGKPVVVEADPALQLHATLVRARGEAPFHVVRYRASFEPERPYLVSYQCGFMLRAAQSPPDARFDLTATPHGKAETERLLKDHFRLKNRTLPGPMLHGLRDQLANGLLLQLRSIPVGLRVDAWIASTYPALHELQRAAVARQLQENAQVLRPEVREIAPERIIGASVSMNAAFAAFFSRLWSERHVTEPYRTAGFLDRGEVLLRHLDSTPPDPANDRQLIDAWGKALQLEGWYGFATPAG